MRKLIVGSLVAAALGGVALPAAARTNVDFFVNIAPPPVYREVVPDPRAGYVWAPGYWDWRYGHHYWIAGNWSRHRPGHHYQSVRWHHRDSRNHRAGGWRDSDYDGVPNRYDRAPNNPRWH